jgi:O-acetyl-ADP-ribose deacetylase (regulator of RNase III)
MIEYHENTDLFKIDTEAICHGVNIRGVAGGLAHSVFERFPENYESYQSACSTGRLAPGAMMSHFENGQWVYNLATQQEPGPDAKIDLVEQAFVAMRAHAIKTKVKSIGCPQVGSGIGGLQWSDVDKAIRRVWSQAHGIGLHIVTRDTF